MTESRPRSRSSTSLYRHDRALAKEGHRIAGVDEAGRGPLAGPVVAAAVCLDLSKFIKGVNDSKKLSEDKREELYEIIVASGCPYGVGVADVKEVDKLNILGATFCAMRRALEKLEGKFDLLLVDGNLFITGVERGLQRPIVGGDGISASIAAASILAKVTRDRMMREYHEIYPQYDFCRNKGYGTEHHRNMIEQHGLCPIHRRTFCHNDSVQLSLAL